MKVVKIGGAIYSEYGKTADILEVFNKFGNEKVVVVISAAGKSTAMLKNIAELAAKQLDYQKVINRLEVFFDLQIKVLFKRKIVIKIIDDIFQQIKMYADSIAITGEYSDRILDKLMSYGEIITAELISELLKENNIDFKFIPAFDIISTDSSFGNANPLREKISENITSKLLPEFDNTNIIITQGFIATDDKSNPTTMGFESSNLTAVLIAENINADEIELWTITKGIRQIDPTYNRFANLIDFLDYETAKKLAKAGLNLLHQEMLELAEKSNIKLSYISAFAPNDEKTIIHNKNNIREVLNVEPIVIVKTGIFEENENGGEVIKINNKVYSFEEIYFNANTYKYIIFNTDKLLQQKLLNNINDIELLIIDKDTWTIFSNTQKLENLINIIFP